MREAKILTRRAGLPTEIKATRREETRRDYSDRTIDQADWLDIRQRAEDDIAKARREYDRPIGSGIVLSDIPPV
jgi:hypothetical protein